MRPVCILPILVAHDVDDFNAAYIPCHFVICYFGSSILLAFSSFSSFFVFMTLRQDLAFKRTCSPRLGVIWFVYNYCT